MKLDDLFDYDRLLDRIGSGHVRVRQHPQDPGLLILNYTEKAQFEKKWDDVTTQCRGLIVQVRANQRPQDSLVVARPWPKFFNLGEHVEQMALDAPVVAQDKMDGSLGILYCDPDGQWSISTRGSFESDQAIHATKVWREFYEDYWAPRPGYTYLFEIVYPANRIVLDYGTTDDLFLLDILETETGRSVLLYGEKTNHGFPGKTTGQFLTRTLGEALGMADRENAEGLVLTYEDGLKIKVKQEDYVRLHKLVTGLNERSVWEHLRDNEGRVDQLLMVIPDEFHDWVQATADTLLSQFEEIQGRAHAAYHDIVGEIDDNDLYSAENWEREHRAAFAERAKTYPDLTGALFQMLDGRDISAGIWKTLRPRGDVQSLLDRSEDNS